MGAFDGIKSTLKQNSFFGVLDGWKDGVENKLADPTQRGTLGKQNNVQVGTTEGAITRNADGSMSIYTNGSWQPYNSVLGGSGNDTGSGAYVDQGSATDAAGVAESRAYLDDQQSTLERLLGSLNTSKQNALTQLGTNYDTEKLAGEQKYGQQFEDNTRSKMGALGAVDTKARTGRNSLQRLLGLSGSAGQSAGMVADSAVARQAAQDRAKQLETSATNERDITNSKDSFLQNLLKTKKEREQSIENDYLTNYQDYNSQIADVAGQRASLNGGNYAAVKAARSPYQSAIEQSQNTLDSLFSKYATPFNAEAKLADLGQFNVDQTAINANKQFGTSDSSPYAQFLAKKRQQTAV